jgi:hypothetical protein
MSDLDPDPGGPKTYGSGSDSTTLVATPFLVFEPLVFILYEIIFLRPRVD